MKRQLKYLRLPFYRDPIFSRKISSKINVGNGGRCIINTDTLKKCAVHVTASWNDHCTFNFNANHFLLTQDDSTIEISSASVEKNAADIQYAIEIELPEYFDIFMVGNAVDFTLKNKIQGDLYVDVSDGCISIDKVRGSFVNISGGNASVNISKSVEGNVTIDSLEVDAKMIHASTCAIQTKGNINIGAIYAATCTASSKTGSISVGSARGSVNLAADVGDIVLGSVDGSFALAAAEGRCSVHANKLYDSSIPNTVKAKKDVRFSVNPELSTELTCKLTTSKRLQALVESAHTKQPDSVDYRNHAFGESKIQILVEKFRVQHATDRSIMGFLSGQPITSSSQIQDVTSTPSQAISRRTSGKIDVDAAALQSLFGNSQTPTKSGDIKDESQLENVTASSSTSHAVLLESCSGILVESISWIESIRRKISP